MDLKLLYDRLNFPLTLLLAEALICSRFGKKEKLWLRVILSSIPTLLFAWFTAGIPWGSRWSMFANASKFLGIFACSLVFMGACFQGDFWANLFAGIAAYCAQHIAYQSHTLIKVLLGVTDTLPDMLILLACCTAVYGLLYYTFIRKLKSGEPVQVNNHAQMVLSGVVLAITVYTSFYGIVYAIASGNVRLQYVVLIFSILSCFLGLMLELSFVQLKRNEIEMAILKHMVHQAKSQYNQTKENIDLINIKCHDLRHQITHLKGKVDREELDSIAQAVRIYDASFKTGNDALDVVLMEKSLHCTQRGIRLTCMMDASLVSRMKYSDIYALFGNAIENAMESVSGLEEEKRSISLSGWKSGGYGIIRIENYYSGDIAFADGLPQTRKSPDYHGFGVKSMKIVAEKYGGELEFSLHGDIFRLEIFLPQEEAQTEAPKE